MDVIMIIAAVVATLVGLDLLALRYGADSRGSFRDDPARSAGFGGCTGEMTR